MQTTSKIAGEDAQGYARYLTSDSARGDYYLGDGEDGEDGAGAHGRWHGSPAALASLGLVAERPVERAQLLALMQGLSPASGAPIRPAGGDGTRVAGIDMAFSAPKSVSALWAVSSSERREQIERAHRDAVSSAIGRVERQVEVVRSRQQGTLCWEHARSLVAAQFLHTSSRLTVDQERGGVPDPQLHSHVVVLAAERQDGRFAAVDSRELFRAARANGAWYRAELAANLQRLGLQVEGRTGNDGRYFELRGVPADLAERWSSRSQQIDQAAREFRTRYGRDPQGGELSSITKQTRGTKTALAPSEAAAAWRAVGEEHGLGSREGEGLFNAHVAERQQHELRKSLGRDLIADLTSRASMVTDRDLHARLFELAAGVCRPGEAQTVIAELHRSGELVRLQGGMWTTRELRALEQRTAGIATERAAETAAPVSEHALQQAAGDVEREIGGALSDEQRRALERITGRGGVSVLVGQAGTGKGVVIRAAVGAWQREGNAVIGTAVAGATAERLAAEASPDSSMTTDSLIARVQHGSLALNEKTVVVMDEAGMADTRRLAALMHLTQQSQSKLLLVGDGAQLSPIGAGGLFGQVAERVPAAELTEIRRARHAWERQAWQQVRDGQAQQALASYRAHGQLHISDTRQDAAQRMVAAWDQAQQQLPDGHAVMLTDGSNRELDQINALAQYARDLKGEIGTDRVPLKDRPYSLATGDRVIFTASHPQPGRPRVENGTTGTIHGIDRDGRLSIKTGAPREREVNVDTREFQAIKLAYAQHVYKAQGATVERSFVLIGGWQTSRESAYVALTRARESTDIHATRADLGEQGLDPGAIERLGDAIARSDAQEASISREQDPRPASDAPSQIEPLSADPAADIAPTESAREQLSESSERPLSEIGRILAEQEERERHEAENERDPDFRLDDV